MQKRSVYQITATLFLSLSLSLNCWSDDGPATTSGDSSADKVVTPAKEAAVSDNVIATVGDQAITFPQINTMLNSSAVVGLSIPALGSPERDKVRIVLLDKVVSANLIYLDAIKQGVDKDPEYQRELQRFSGLILAGLYRDQYMAGDATISEEEIQAFYDTQIISGTELTDELRTQIEATLRQQKREQNIAKARKALRDGIEVVVFEENISVSGQEQRPDSTIVAKVDEEVISWGDVKQVVIAADKGEKMTNTLAMDDDAGLPVLQREIDVFIMNRKAREAGLDKDPLHLTRYEEFRKTRLINTHRETLTERMMPSDEELKAYYDQNRDAIAVPEFRKVQEVVLPTREEAENIKARVEAGEITMYEAARDHSVAPGAKQNLGEIGWVSEGRPLPEMNEVIFSLNPGEFGGPVETPAGWHIVIVLDVTDAEYTDFEEERTRTLALRKYIHEKLDKYVVNLRQNEFDVKVYEDNLLRLAQAEADMVKDLTEKAKQPGSITQQRIEEMQKYMKP